MSITVKAPGRIPDGISIFLAGSIEMGMARSWQAEVERALSDLSVVICNPRRDDWDSSWEQSSKNAHFLEQVTWELEALENANVIAFYFDPKTKSPISLLELGRFSDPEKTVVCCPNGFWRKGNVDVFCARYGVRQAKSITELIRQTRAMLTLRLNSEE